MFRKFIAGAVALALVVLSVPSQAIEQTALVSGMSRVAPVSGVSLGGEVTAAPSLVPGASLDTAAMPQSAVIEAAEAAVAALPAQAFAPGAVSAASKGVSAQTVLTQVASKPELTAAAFDRSRVVGQTDAIEGSVKATVAPSLLKRTLAAGKRATYVAGAVLAAAPFALADSGSGVDGSSSLLGSILGNWYYFVAGAAILILAWKSFVNVGAKQVATIERKYFGTPLPEGHIIATGNQIGLQAKLLGPGPHLVAPWNKVTKGEMRTLAADEVGLVEAIDGQPSPQGHYFAQPVEGHNLFQDAEAFLKNNGQKGKQLQVIPGGAQYRINERVFKVKPVKVETIAENEVGIVIAKDGVATPNGQILAKKVEGHNNFQDAEAFMKNGGQSGIQADVLGPKTYRINTDLFEVKHVKAQTIPQGMIGLVTAKIGKSLPQGQVVAAKMTGHNNYQDAQAFLDAGGQAGPQEDVLTPGTWRINTEAFEVKQVPITKVPQGEVAVIVSNIGKDPNADQAETGAETERGVSDQRLKSGIERYVVEAGYRGIQQKALGPGDYNLNTVAYSVVPVKTTNVTVDWADEKKEGSEKSFDPLVIVSKDGFEMKVAVKVLIRVLPEQAPLMVSRIGGIQNLINDVIHPLIGAEFRNQASTARAMEFMESRKEQQEKAFAAVKDELAKYHVETLGVLIDRLDLDETLMKTKRDQVVAEQQRAMYDSQQAAAMRRVETDKANALANQQPDLVRAQMGVQIAEENKKAAIIAAQAQSEKTRLEQEGIASGIAAVGRAEAEKIAAIGQATAKAYLQQAEALGAQALAGIEIVKQIAEGKIKVTPEILVQGGGNGEGTSQNVLSAFIASLMASGRSINPQVPPAPQTPNNGGGAAGAAPSGGSKTDKK